MKNNEASVFVFIATIIVGILISMNISFSKTSKIVILDSKQYQDAYNTKNKLQSDISTLIDNYNIISRKLIKYKSTDKTQVAVTNEMNSELQTYKIGLGLVALHGQGLILTINDADEKYFDDPSEYALRIVHNTDIILVLNDLNNGGAEAVSINGQRITENSEVLCDGPFLRINNTKIAAPFTIYAIGNKDTLYDYMMLDENHIKVLKLRNVSVKIEKTNDVKLPAFTGPGISDFLKPVR
jgi:uncharacterized protein YlxW (UPF0749 family)